MIVCDFSEQDVEDDEAEYDGVVLLLSVLLDEFAYQGEGVADVLQLDQTQDHHFVEIDENGQTQVVVL